jgi:hypothetical protein
MVGCLEKRPNRQPWLLHGAKFLSVPSFFLFLFCLCDCPFVLLFSLLISPPLKGKWRIEGKLCLKALGGNRAEEKEMKPAVTSK